jgi:hypothetical protein
MVIQNSLTVAAAMITSHPYRGPTINDERLALNQIAERAGEEQHGVSNVVRGQDAVAGHLAERLCGEQAFKLGSCAGGVGVDPAGLDRVEVDAAVAEFQREMSHRRFQSGFARPHETAMRQREIRPRAGQRNHLAVARRPGE